MIIRLLLLSLLTLPLTSFSDSVEVVVLEPYIELRTGPGRGFPVFHVVEQNQPIQLLKRRTNWVLVQSMERRPEQGWVRSDEIAKTAAAYDDAGEVLYASLDDFDRSNSGYFQWTVSGGDFDGAPTISTAVSYRFTPNLAVQLEAEQILGDFSNGKMLNGYLQHHPFPHWRVSPYFQLGAGILQTEPSATIVQTIDRTDNTLIVGGGLNLELNKRFHMFLDFRRHNVLTSRDDNEEIDEWKLGFNVSL